MESISSHARRRAQQRGISLAAIEATLDWGLCIRQVHGRRAWHLGRRHVARALRAGTDLRQFENTAVVLAADHTVVTVIRTDDTSKLRRFSNTRPPRRRAWRH